MVVQDGVKHGSAQGLLPVGAQNEVFGHEPAGRGLGNGTMVDDKGKACNLAIQVEQIGVLAEAVQIVAPMGKGSCAAMS
jgi:hypothetical protein